MRYRVMRMASCLCHIAQCVGGEIEAVNQTFGESSVGICFVLFLERAFLPHFRVFAVSVGHPCGNCLSDKRMDNRGEDDRAPSLARENLLRSPEAPGVERIRT